MEEIAKEGARLVFSQAGLMGVVAVMEAAVIIFMGRTVRALMTNIGALQAARVDDHKTLATEAIRTMQTISTTAATQATATENNTRVIQERNRAFETVAVGTEALGDKVDRLSDDVRRLIDRGGSR